MEVFTYSDYLKTIHTLRLNAVFKIAEDETNYAIEKNKENLKKEFLNKKIKEMILDKKSEVKNIINEFLKLKIKEQELIKYNNKYLNKKYEKLNNAVIYKLKDKKVYFIIQFQPIINNNILYNLLNYCVDTMYYSINVNNCKNERKYPIIVPIIIYNGIDEWKISNDLSQLQISDYIFKNYKIKFKYNLIEINKYSKNDLILKNTLFTHFMALQMCETDNEFNVVLSQILNKCENRYKEEICKFAHLFRK